MTISAGIRINRINGRDRDARIKKKQKEAKQKSTLKHRVIYRNDSKMGARFTFSLAKMKRKHGWMAGNFG